MSRAIFGVIVVSVFLRVTLTTAKKPDFMDDAIMEFMMPDKIECMNKFGTTEELIDQGSAGLIANDRRLTCYLACMLEKAGMIAEDGNIDSELYLNIVRPDLHPQAKIVLQTCRVLQGADACEKSYHASLCLLKHLPEMWVVF